MTAFAPRFAYELWVLPTAHASRFESITDERAARTRPADEAGCSRSLDVVQAEPAYNWFLHTAPLRSPELPTTTGTSRSCRGPLGPAGLEWGYGCFITTVAPETAAAELRAALPE